MGKFSLERDSFLVHSKLVGVREKNMRARELCLEKNVP